MFKIDGNSIYVYGVIGPSWAGYISDSQVIDALHQLKGKEVHLRINSPGGSVDMGISIQGAIKRHGNVISHIDALGASIASVFPLASKQVVISKGAKMMIHEPWTIELGNAKILRKTAEVLDKYNADIADIYNEKTGKPIKKIFEMLEAETWFTSQEAIDFGLADAVDPNAPEEEPVAPQGLFKNVPSDVRQSASPIFGAVNPDYNLILAKARQAIAQSKSLDIGNL